MKFILILGDSAVGKMTVGQELEKLTGFSLFHNHMTIELVLNVFKSFHITAIEGLRKVIFEEFTKTNLPGLIVTLQLPFDMQEEITYLDNLIEFFENKNVETFIVELDASLEERLKRNQTENRLKNKISKRNIALSESRLLNDYNNHRFISLPGEIKHKNFMQIENTNLTAEEVAKIIVKHFKLMN